MKRSPLWKLMIVGIALLFVTTDQTQAEARVSVGCTTTALVAAINTANGTPAADTLDLPANCTYTFSSASDTDAVSGDSALPKITTPITINGNGAIIERANAAPIFRLFYVSSSGNLTLNQTVLRGGQTAKLGAADVRSFGGGILSWLGTVTVNNSRLSGNDADYGGGLFTNGGTATVTDSTLSGNHADNWGGGIYTYQGTLTVTSSTLSSNDASDGGGIYNYWGMVTVTNSTLAANSATAGTGGGIYNHSGGSTVTVNNSILSGNSSLGGGGIYNAGTLTVTNSTLSGNSGSGSGGGIFNFQGTVTVTNSTLSGNSATFGGGIYNNDRATVTNSIVWSNTQFYAYGFPDNVTYSIMEGMLYPGTGNLSSDPQFVLPVSSSSAPTTAGDYRLRHVSPAIDAGSNAALPADTQDLDGDGDTGEPLPYDLDGNARIINGTVDMGAYEVGELLDNRNFEVDEDDDNVPDGWTVKNADGDKRKCNKPDKTVALEGECAFKFKGGLGEKAALQQNVEVRRVYFEVGDVLTLRAYFKGASATKAKLLLKVKYAGISDVSKSSTTIGATTDYTPFSAVITPLLSADVEQIKVMVKHKSTAGKLFVDTASLSHVAGTRRSELLPPPAAPDGMRGFN